MVYVTPAIRWVSGVWGAVALATIAWSVMAGLRPVSTLVLLVVCAAPLVLVWTLVGFGSEPRTAAQVLHGGDRPAGLR